jgi:hypothetical protein
VLRPIDFGSLGIYALSLQTGTMAAGLAANSEIYQARWTHATNVALVKQFRLDGGGGIAAFAAGFYKHEAMVARAWSVDGSGGTAATLSGNNNKLRTSMGTTGFGAIRIAGTAALSAGTKTLDTQGFGAAMGGLTATAGASMPAFDLFNPESESEFPLVLATNEGVIVRTTVPATGTWTAGITLKWAELTSY